MTAGVAAAAGLLITGGLLALVAGLRRTDRGRPVSGGEPWGLRWARLSRRPAGARGRRRDLIVVLSLIAGLVGSVVTGWVLLVIVVPLIALGLPPLLSLPQQRDVAMMEALDRWLRTLTATLATGKSVTDAIRVSLRTAPPAIRNQVAILVARLNNRWDTTDALRQFADDLDSPDGDAVVAALILAANRGSVGASATLHALADSLQDQLKARRVIETERAKPYVVVRQVTVITTLTLAAVFVFNPGYFAPYRTPSGQLILTALIGLYVGSLVLMRRKARQQGRERILVGARR